MKNKPLISVIVPCYNQAQYLDECLQSVLDQTYTNWECIIVNDGSPDNTEEVALRWVEKDNRFKYIKKENGGLSSARNAGIKIAEGEWILPLDADDKIANTYFSLSANYFTNIENIIYGKAVKFGLVNEIWQLPIYNIKDMARYNIIYCSAFFSKKLFKKIGGYDEFMKNGWEDWEFWIRAIKNGATIKQIDEIVFHYRIKNKSMLKNINRTIAIENYKYVENKHFDFFLENLGTLHEKINLIYDNKVIVDNYSKIINSKIFKLVNKIFKII